jgi:hypothetical protein
VATTGLPPAAVLGGGDLARWPSLSASTTFRRWRTTLLWTLAALLLALLCNPFDTYQGWFEFELRRPRRYRMFIQPADIPMRVFGLPHFLIATLFVLGSSRMREAANRLRLAGLAVVAVLLCVLFARAGAQANPVAIFLFYAYFIVHQLRDEAYFYKTYGELPAQDPRRHERIVASLQWLAIGLLFAVAWPTITTLPVRDYDTTHSWLQGFYPAEWSFAARLAVTAIPMLAVTGVVLGRLARSFPDGLAGLWRVHRPILVVQLATMAIVLLGLVAGTGVINAVVLMHFVGWYLFALNRLDRSPASSPRVGTWEWMRTTRRGFMTLHLGLAALVAAGMAIDVYGYGQQSWLHAIVGAQSFYYFTIAHVTLSFLPR